MKGGTHTWFASSLRFHAPHPFPVPHRGSPEPYLLIMGISGKAACSAGACQGMGPALGSKRKNPDDSNLG